MNLYCFVYILNRKNRPRNGGICVANHTSPIDVIILASDGYYAMVRLLSFAFLGQASNFRDWSGLGGFWAPH